MNSAKLLTIGIDASNLVGGGGVTHLVEILRVAQPEVQGIGRIVVWGGITTLNLIEDRPWLKKRDISWANKSLFDRMLWQRFRLSCLARSEACDVLFIPGGAFVGDFRPFVTMSRNLLPFDVSELHRYNWTFLGLRLLLLRFVQVYSFKKANGVIFLTEYARNAVKSVTGNLFNLTCIIPHGLNLRFRMPPKLQYAIGNYDFSSPYRILYVSIIDQYKHQWHVVEAIATLRKRGFQIMLDLVGPAYPPALKRLNQAIDRFDFHRAWVRYHGAIPFDELHLQYSKADLGLFASSCENMPNILLETMASGLPIACSNRGPMPEVLGDCGVFFDPERSDSIIDALLKMIESEQLRADLADASYRRSAEYSWQRCAQDTFSFINEVAHKHINV
jgi:glycosyltransferase involved in cell wall biosynthesis